MLKALKSFLVKIFNPFTRKKHIKLGLYGPPNAGKCLTPESEIILFNGKIVSMKELFDQVREKKSKFASITKFEEFRETYLDTTDLNLSVPSLDPKTLKIVPKQIQLVYAQKYKGPIYKVTTQSGRTIRGTAEHPVITLSNNGLRRVKLAELQKSEAIAITANLALSTDISLNEITAKNYNINGQMIQMAQNSNNDALKTLADADCMWDQIKEITQEDYDGYVYDITVADTHTFLLSNGMISGNSSIANRICKDWLGEEMSQTSRIPHETREIIVKEKISIKSRGKELTFNLVDTPGIATKIDYEDFLKYKMKEKEAKQRAKEATKGVIDAIKWLDNLDCVLVVLDATQNPYNQVNITIIGNLAAREIPVLIIGNKTDLRKADIERIKSAFPQYPVVGISATKSPDLEELYEEIFKVVR